MRSRSRRRSGWAVGRTPYNNLGMALLDYEGARSALDVVREGLRFTEARGLRGKMFLLATSEIDLLLSGGDFGSVLAKASALVERAEAAGGASDVVWALSAKATAAPSAATRTEPSPSSSDSRTAPEDGETGLPGVRARRRRAHEGRTRTARSRGVAPRERSGRTEHREHRLARVVPPDVGQDGVVARSDPHGRASPPASRLDSRSPSTPSSPRRRPSPSRAETCRMRPNATLRPRHDGRGSRPRTSRDSRSSAVAGASSGSRTCPGRPMRSARLATSSPLWHAPSA